MAPMFKRSEGRDQPWDIRYRDINPHIRENFHELFLMNRSDSQWLDDNTRSIKVGSEQDIGEIARYHREGGDISRFHQYSWKNTFTTKDYSPLPLVFLMASIPTVFYFFPGGLSTFWVVFVLTTVLLSPIHKDTSSRTVRSGMSKPVARLMNRLNAMRNNLPLELNDRYQILWDKYEKITESMPYLDKSLDSERIREQDRVLGELVKELDKDITELLQSKKEITINQVDESQEQLQDFQRQAMIESNQVNEDIADDVMNMLKRNK